MINNVLLTSLLLLSTNTLASELFAINGVSIGDDKTKLISRFGQPIEIQSEPPQFGEIEESYRFSNANVHITDRTISNIRAWGTEYSTSNGISPGDAVSKLIKNKGKPTYINKDLYAYQYKDTDCYYRFKVNQSVVRQIELWCAQ